MHWKIETLIRALPTETLQVDVHHRSRENDALRMATYDAFTTAIPLIANKLLIESYSEPELTPLCEAVLTYYSDDWKTLKSQFSQDIRQYATVNHRRVESSTKTQGQLFINKTEKGNGSLRFRIGALVTAVELDRHACQTLRPVIATAWDSEAGRRYCDNSHNLPVSPHEILPEFVHPVVEIFRSFWRCPGS